MNHRRTTPGLLLLVALFAAACGDEPTSPRSGHRPKTLIFDGTHEQGNKDVFFLPPLVRNPSALFDAKFNPNLNPVFEVCPTADLLSDDCTGPAIATFGNVAGATGPIALSVQDQHYLALWHTGDANLDPGVYLLRVFFAAPASGDEPVAWAHVQVVGSGRELKNVADETIALLDGRTLPIKVRFETECASANCVSEIVTNAGNVDDPLVLESGDGALVLTAGWLPPGISSARVTLQRHEPGPNNDCVGKAAFTGPGLVTQRQACLEVTTDPPILATDPENPEPTKGIRAPAYIFACLELESEDPFESFLQIIKADDGRPLQALPDVSDEDIQEFGFDLGCGDDEVEVGGGNGLLSHPVVRLASRALGSVARPVARLFEVKSLYAIDLGQGGEISLFDGFSFFTFGVQPSGVAFESTPATAPAGNVLELVARVLKHEHHEGDEGNGIPNVDLTFRVTDGDGRLRAPGDEGPFLTSVTVSTGTDGLATVDLDVAVGATTIEAVVLVDGVEVTEAATVTIVGTLLADLAVTQFSVSPPNPTTADAVTYTIVIANLGQADAPATTGTFSFGWSRMVGENQEVSQSVDPFFDVPAVPAGESITLTLPQGTLSPAASWSAGLTLNTGTPSIAESTRGNNSGSVSFTVTVPIT
jgi:hypothetical protein